jgi:hypothetical protein
LESDRSKQEVIVAIGLKTEVRGLRETLIELRQLDAEVYKQINSDIKNAAGPFARGIESGLPKSLPIKGFTHNGATAFKTSENKTDVKISVKKPRSDRPTSLLKVIVKGRGLAIADMAGHPKSRYTPKSRSAASARRPTGYRMNGQGAGLKRKLGPTQGSRFVWPAALKNQNLIDNSIERSLQEASAKVNRNLLVVK